MWWQEAIWKQMGFNHTTFQQSIPSLGFRTTTCNHVFICFLSMSFAQFLLRLFSFEGILAYELMAGHPPFESFGCNMFCRTFKPPASPRTRGPRTRCKFTRRRYLDATKKQIKQHGEGMWTGWISDARWTKASTRWTSRRSVRDLSRTPWSCYWQSQRDFKTKLKAQDWCKNMANRKFARTSFWFTP